MSTNILLPNACYVVKPKARGSGKYIPCKAEREWSEYIHMCVCVCVCVYFVWYIHIYVCLYIYVCVCIYIYKTICQKW